jgi:cell division topological specificity factor
MKLFQLFKARGSAPVARERLQILLAHERVALGPEDLLGKLRGEIIATVLRHIQVDPGKIMVKMDHDATVSTLEIEVEIPKESIVGDGKRRPPADPPPMTSAA